MPYDNLNMRVIKPYKPFYSSLISLVLIYGVQNLHTVARCDFVEAAQHRLGALWKPTLQEPTEAFFDWCLPKSVGRVASRLEFFEAVRSKMLIHWNAEIVLRSNGFKKAKIEHLDT